MSKESDFAEIYKALGAYRSQQGRDNRAAAAADFTPASQLAAANGMKLIRYSDTHYRLVLNAEGFWNLYPGNRRIEWNGVGSRFLAMPNARAWGLIDVVRAAMSLEVCK